MAAAPLPKRERRRRRPEAAGAEGPEPKGGAVPPPAWARPACQYEYLDHTADVQIHSWGCSLEQALEQAVLGLTGYMTDIKSVAPAPDGDDEIEVEAGDLLGLVYRLLDECLFRFCGDGKLTCEASVSGLELPGGVPSAITRSDGSSPPSAGTAARLRCRVRGEAFERGRHPSGTEIKAITYSQMSVQPPTAAGGTAGPAAEAAASSSAPERYGGEEDDRPYAATARRDDTAWHIFVIVDI